MTELVTNETLLRRPCEPVSLREAGEISRTLVSWMRRHNTKARRKASKLRYDKTGEKAPPLALGLAAPQLGILKQVAVVFLNEVPIVLVNPVILDRSAQLVPFEETCLSLPGVEVTTMRSTWVVVKSDNWGSPRRFGLNNDGSGKPRELLKAICCQHETDHLFSRLILDFNTEVRRDSNSDGDSMRPMQTSGAGLERGLHGPTNHGGLVSEECGVGSCLA